MRVSVKKKITIKDILILQAIIVIYTISSVAAKFAGMQELLSIRFFLFCGLDAFILGIYAILWQQMIKKFDLSIAYTNRAMTLLWAVIWAVLIFREHITVQNICGVLLVIIGTIIVNTDHPIDETKSGDAEKEGMVANNDNEH